MKNNLKSILSDQKGNAMVITMVVLVALTALAVVTIRISTTNLDMATNEKYHKLNFFKTDADSELISEMIEQNIEQRGLDNSTPPINYGNSGDIAVYNNDFHMNGKDPVCQNNIPTESNRDIQVSTSGKDTNESYVRVYGDRAYNPGSGIEIAAGYHGRGKSAASGGVQILYTIRVYGRGVANSQTRVALGWRHVT